MKASFLSIKNSLFVLLVSSCILSCNHKPASLLVEAENFSTKGGWVVDQQFMDLMGSPYLNDTCDL
ncbi:hypothetical protein AGMMS50239_36150 [Bacteroidia bacterium]|nr:hypothetical protein AGMMS50239_36150 [Bacteroidia bacterium]